MFLYVGYMDNGAVAYSRKTASKGVWYCLQPWTPERSTSGSLGSVSQVRQSCLYTAVCKSEATPTYTVHVCPPKVQICHCGDEVDQELPCISIASDKSGGEKACVQGKLFHCSLACFQTFCKQCQIRPGRFHTWMMYGVWDCNTQCHDVLLILPST